jgi:protein-L-isoaspartate(D-aspartate) O-methyltransferase
MTATPDFARARINMVNAQLSTNGIRHEGLIEAYKTLARENFVDPAQAPYVYLDEDLPLRGGKRWLLEPVIEARLLQALISEPAAYALVLGAASLPSVAMLARFVTTVIVLEPDPDIATAAQKRLSAQEVCNTVVVETAYREGYPRQAPYDVIFIPGAVAAIPETLVDQLSTAGRLACVLREKPNAAGRACIVRPGPAGRMNAVTIADAATPYLAGFEPARDFVF